MRLAIGIVLGAFSGFLIYMMLGMAFVSDAETVSGWFVAVTFFGGWIGSTWLMVRETRTSLKVVRRGALIGAAEWLLMIPAGMALAGRSISGMELANDAEVVGATVGAGAVSVLTGGLAIAMAVVCLIVFVVAYFLGKELEPEAVSQTGATGE